MIGTEYTLSPIESCYITFILNGAAGGGSLGGKGGNVTGTILLQNGENYKLIIGKKNYQNGRFI